MSEQERDNGNHPDNPSGYYKGTTSAFLWQKIGAGRRGVMRVLDSLPTPDSLCVSGTCSLYIEIWLLCSLGAGYHGFLLQFSVYVTGGNDGFAK
jgi:hypothetical protein